MKRVDAFNGRVYFIFQPDTDEDAHVGLARDDDAFPGWSLSNMAVPVPAEAAVFFPMDEQNVWSAASGLTLEQTARAATVLIGYLYRSPSEVRATYASHWPLTLSAEDAAKLLASLTGDEAPSLPVVEAIPTRPAQPPPRLIRTTYDAELVAADWVRWFGYSNVGVTPVGPDAGIDVFSDEVIAQVKMEGVPTGRPVIQNAYGVAAAEGKTAMVFSLGGYVRTAIEWADKVDMPLFRFDHQGVPEAVNGPARRLIDTA